MKPVLPGLLLAAALAVSGCADMGVTSASVTLRSAPPPPAFSYDRDPDFRYISDLRVYVISDDSFGYDMFRYGGYYYVYSSGYWYRSDSPRGTWIAVDERRVPSPIFRVDDQRYHWRAHPQRWQGGQGRGHGRGNDRGNGNDHGGGNH